MKRTEISGHPDAALPGRLAAGLRERGPLAALDPELAAGLLRLSALVELAPGEVLIREDEAAAQEVYVLVEGALVVKSRDGVLARLDRPGDVAGEVAVLLTSRRTADVIAETAVRALAIPASALARPEYAQVTEGISGAMIRDDWVKY
jgi:CRP-like cAMP-binding protein